MSEDDAKIWVKNKANQDLVLKMFLETNPPVRAKVAFFMAGIPGAGKTEFAENTIRESSSHLLPIEHDKLVEYIEGYQPEDYYNFRKAGSVLVTRIFDDAIKNGYAFIFDGTLSHENGARNIKKALNAGYDVYVVYIVQEARLAWELTQAREVVKKRSIQKSGFISTCNKLNANLSTIFSNFRANKAFHFWIINKQGNIDMKSGSITLHDSQSDKHLEIEKELSKTYNLDEIG